jgi:hypothetical protein
VGGGRQPEQRHPLGSQFQAVKCLSPKWCVAVGLYEYDTARTIGQHTLVEFWNGKTWRIVPSPNTAGDQSEFLYAVDCVSSTWCMIGGQGQRGGVIEHWNGHIWTVMGHPKDKQRTAALLGMSCVSRTACVAVDFNHPPLAESWNGKVWSFMHTAALNYFYFLSVSCITATLCKGVGWRTAVATTG